MRLNKFIAESTGMSRRSADAAIAEGRVSVNDQIAPLGQQISNGDIVLLDDRAITPVVKTQTIILHKPVGYVCSRDGQGSKTVYDLLPADLHHLKPVGRLDKDSSGLLLLTNDGDLAHKLTHPSFQKTKTYTIVLDKSLRPLHHQMIADHGVNLEDGLSKFQLQGQATNWTITMHEGRNRQIRRTFAALGYAVTKLHRTQFGNYTLGHLAPKQYISV